MIAAASPLRTTGIDKRADFVHENKHIWYEKVHIPSFVHFFVPKTGNLGTNLVHRESLHSSQTVYAHTAVFPQIQKVRMSS